MKYGNVLVEQVTAEGDIVLDYDTSLTTKELAGVLSMYFPNLRRMGNFFVGEYAGHKYAIRCKNVTYLGIPHPAYKKRIQIADDLRDFYYAARRMDAVPILLGVYTYKDNTIFVEFGIDTYIFKSAHNSSAHIYSSDLAMVLDGEDKESRGFFQKTDYFGNSITAFKAKPLYVTAFLNMLFGIGEEVEAAGNENVGTGQPTFEFTREVVSSELGTPTPIGQGGAEPSGTSHRYLSYHEKFKEEVVPRIQEFFLRVPKNWHGINCYQEMIAANYRNKFQPEWVGFFLEYIFERYVVCNGLESMITYYQDKKDGGIDLDLYFPGVGCFGDLKAHSEDSKGIQGNDWGTVMSVLDRNDETSHIYYIVCEHETQKDNLYNYEVTRFWNGVQGKPDLMSYYKRMKHHVVLKRVYILDINPGNRQYLSMFRQGINSNGKPRAPKIMIDHENIDKFLLAEIIL